MTRPRIGCLIREGLIAVRLAGTILLTVVRADRTETHNSDA